MAETLKCRIVATHGTVFEGEVRSVRAPAHEGDVCILKDHIAFVTPLRKGTVTLDTAGEPKAFNLDHGVLEVLNNQVTIIAQGLAA
ncbi:MAG: ATP synthase F1 subunit epsilon [Nitrospirae bacterium]|nr:ATP synthase F1 subunit epsilon [Nitrospirota bacterium]